MPTEIEVKRMLGRKEPLTRWEWIQILECVTEMLRPIFKSTTFEKLYDIRLGHPSSFLERDRFFLDQEEAHRIIQFDNACERGASTEGIFFFADNDRWGKNAEDATIAPILGLTRNGKWVRGRASWIMHDEDGKPSRDEVSSIRFVSSFWLSATDPKGIGFSDDFRTPDVVDILFAVLGNIIMRKKMQLIDLKNVSKQIGNIILTARYIPKEAPRT